MNIKQASLVLGSVGITNVFLNPVYLQSKEGVKSSFLNDIYQALRAVGTSTDEWYLGLFNGNSKYDDLRELHNRFSRSHSSYEIISKKEVLLTCSLSEVRLSSLKSSFTQEEKKLVKEIPSLLDQMYRDGVLYIFENGNAVVLSTIHLLDSYDTKAYESICKLFHKYFSVAYKDIVLGHIGRLQQAYKMYSHKYEKPFAAKYITDDSVNQLCLQKSFQYAIYNHFFDLGSNDDCHCLEQLFKGSEDTTSLKYIETHDVKISLGYTHASFVKLNSNQDLTAFVNTYKIPLLMVLANWAAIKALSINLEHIGQIYRLRGENKYNFFGLKNERNAINLYLLALKSISASLEGYNASNHPIYSNIIENYRLTFQEERNVKRLNQQIDILTSLSNEIDRQRTVQAEFILNSSIILLTALSIFSTVELFFKINLDYDLVIRQAIITISLIFATLLFAFNLMFHKFKI